MYSELSDDTSAFYDYKEKWKKVFNNNLDEDQFEDALLNVSLLTNNVKIQSFQFRFLCHSIITNKQLKQWGLAESDRCTFCKDEYETQTHLFLECQVVLSFYQQVLVWFECLTDNEYNFDKLQTALLYKKEIMTLDRVLLLAKQYIYAIRCNDKELNIYNFKKHVFKIVRTEKYIAIKLAKEKQFCKRWSLLLK